jgi:hypothetical protein
MYLTNEAVSACIIRRMAKTTVELLYEQRDFWLALIYESGRDDIQIQPRVEAKEALNRLEQRIAELEALAAHGECMELACPTASEASYFTAHASVDSAAQERP